ncbi:MAG: hypothetical protein LBS84_05215 [Clostridiales bacterium]|jgi:hypothetical protein|nr:hypothetical protein [Clostridiales bacterium]
MDVTEIIDITHKSKYFQNEPLKEKAAQEKILTDLPVNVTIESAISYYTTHAAGEYETLYKRTAQWLKMVLHKT